MQSRRDFLKLLGMAMGASLSGCGSSGDAFAVGNTSLTPLAYRYVKLIKSGDPLPGGARLAARLAYSLDSTGDEPPPFMGAVMLTDSRHVYFHALDEDQNRGIYRIDVDDGGRRSEVKEIIREGTVLPDGTVVKDFSDGDVNNGDDFVLAVENPEGIYSFQYSDGGGSFATVARSGGTLGSVKLAEDIDQYQSVADDGTIMFVSEYMDDEEDCQGEGVFVMPADSPDQAQRLFSKGDLVPGTRSVIETFGAAEILSGGRYIIQGSARPASGSDDSGRPLTFLFRGVVGGTPQVLVLDPALGNFDVSSPNFGVLQGGILMCPRFSARGNVGYVLQTADADRTSLWVNAPGGRPNNRREVCAGNINGWPPGSSRNTRSPRGASILSIMPPVFSPNGLVYFEVFTDQGMEIVLWDGTSSYTLLARGDIVDGKRVETIIFGALPDCVNANGEFAAIVEFDDGETDVYLGMPI
ncbi:MAG: hypothetical protein KC800_12770 [Candidatus Eremiobacteraeota bacterium]|nr:hypothetical protein [Candidatus Eremiobacteraeota bacterium]